MLSILDIQGASAETQVVTSMPTMKTLAPGQSVYFDDKKCPAGTMAKFTKGQRRAQITRKCVRQ
jgi:hypothetical protein